jgi:hypothetical protein
MNLKESLLFNFSGLNIVTYDFNDQKLKESMEQLKLAVEKYRDSTVVVKQLVLSYPSSILNI